MAVLLGEDDHQAISDVLQNNSELVIGAPTKFELLLVASNRIAGLGAAAARELLLSQSVATCEWTDLHADLATDVFLRFGKGRHKAALNFGDCMAYALAKSLDAPLLFKGDDFAQTDIRSAL